MSDTKFRFVRLTALMISGALYVFFALVFVIARLYGGELMTITLVTNAFQENLPEIIILIGLGGLCIALGIYELRIARRDLKSEKKTQNEPT